MPRNFSRLSFCEIASDPMISHDDLHRQVLSTWLAPMRLECSHPLLVGWDS